MYRYASSSFSRFSLCLSLSVSLSVFFCVLRSRMISCRACARSSGLNACSWGRGHCVQVRGTVSAFCRFLWGSRPSFQGCQMSHCSSTQCLSLQANTAPALIITSSTAQGGGGSFKNRKPVGELGCCESRMAERSHWWIERWLMSPLFLSLSLFLSFSDYLPTYLPIYLSIYLSLYLSLICLSNYQTIYVSIHLSIYPFIHLFYLSI